MSTILGFTWQRSSSGSGSGSSGVGTNGHCSFSAMTTTADYGGRRAAGRKVKNGGSLGDGDGGGGDDLYQQHLDDLEERTLLRGMESYGPENFALLRFMLLPVYGSTRRAPRVGQVQRTSKRPPPVTIVHCQYHQQPYNLRLRMIGLPRGRMKNETIQGYLMSSRIILLVCHEEEYSWKRHDARLL
jgi:hypothetical protein